MFFSEEQREKNLTTSRKTWHFVPLKLTNPEGLSCNFFRFPACKRQLKNLKKWLLFILFAVSDGVAHTRL
jgi:hypothetical protein